jgi:Bacterial capsule synthesis protein PGA_cap
MSCASGSATEARRGLVFAAALLLAACAGPPVRAPEAPAAESVALPGPPGIRIAAVGDMMLGTDYPKDILPDDDGAGFLSAVTPILAAADIAFGNLEGVLADDGEPSKQCTNLSACFLFRSPTRYARLFRDAGFDVLSLANNHARDFGEQGRTETMRALNGVGILHSGREGDFASLTVNGTRVAVLAYSVTQESNLLLDYELAADTVAAFAATHDIVVVSFHGGAEGWDVTRLPFAEEEYYGEPRGDVVRFARSMVDAGADLVIGHGPHVVRAAERYRGRLIAYSLGNFATYYGISVNGINGFAPILAATLDKKGRFLEGRIVSTRQIRPAGPSIDPDRVAQKVMRGLSIADFGNSGLTFMPDGRLLPTDRN